MPVHRVKMVVSVEMALTPFRVGVRRPSRGNTANQVGYADHGWQFYTVTRVSFASTR